MVGRVESTAQGIKIEWLVGRVESTAPGIKIDWLVGRVESTAPGIKMSQLLTLYYNIFSFPNTILLTQITESEIRFDGSSNPQTQICK